MSPGMSGVNFPLIKHFRAQEFNEPGKISPELLYWLDAARDLAGIPFQVTSSYRSPEHNAQVGGSPTSLHVLGRACDFATPNDPATLWKVMMALFATHPPELSCEIEYVIADKHWHIGVFPEGDGRASRLILKASD